MAVCFIFFILQQIQFTHRVHQFCFKVHAELGLFHLIFFVFVLHVVI